jgi:methyl-accepting chemotaxis protein
MFRLKLRIGTKLAIASGVGVVLVAAMVFNEQFSNRTAEQLTKLVVQHGSVANSAIAADDAFRRIQLANRDLRAALKPEELQKAREGLQQAASDGEQILTKLEQEAVFAENRERFAKIHQLFKDYFAGGRDIGDQQAKLIDSVGKREEALQNWNRAYAAMLESPGMAGLAFRREIEFNIREANSIFKDARIAAWRVMATNEVVQIDRIAKIDEETTDMLKRARNLADDKSVGDGIDALIKLIANFAAAQQATLSATMAQQKIQAERVAPIGRQSREMLEQASNFATQHAKEAEAQTFAAMSTANSIGLGVGLFVILVLIGSVAFGVLSVARPISRIGEVLMELANGNKAVEIPFAARYDEVGDNARAAATFRDNLLRIEKMEAEQKETEARSLAERKAGMHKLASEFQAAVGNIINTVSTASTQLESAAGTLTRTAESTQQLSGMVASASEEASANVQSVASASEEMTSSVDEIARQVHESSKIAAEAVKQAQKTDARITELSQAASRIGDVVKLITAIAEQTNLLALNATIEAARAGDAGRGFAVVAQEVKALASQTAKATDEIGNQIAGMQTATQDSVAAIKEIGATITRISDIASTIAAAVEEQGAATQEIARNVQQAAQGTAQVATNITDVNRGASETGTASAQVLSSAQSLSTESGHLKREVEKFLTTVRAA